ncbi:MAG: TolC family protein [Bacteroidetes bacterium]|nr:TolC family protein [Bacteroidota bacterium]
MKHYKVHIKNSLLLYLIIGCTTVQAQESLLLKDAITITLEKNYDVQVAKLTSRQAEINNSAGEAGMLPVVSLDGNYSKTDLNLKQNLADGRVIEQDGAASTLYNASAGLNWILFDGLTMFARKERLGSFAEESRLTMKLQMEGAIQQVIAAYFAVKVEEENLKTLAALLKVDSIRVVLAEARLEAGNGSKPAVLQAKLEQNLHLAQQLERKSALLTQMENLNILLGRDPSILFTATDSIVIGSVAIDESSRNNDLRLRLAEQQKRTAFQWLQENKGARWPVLTLNADYSFNKTENEAGFLLENQNFGPGIGLNFRWNIFNGFRTNRLIKNAELNLQIAETMQMEVLSIRQQAEKKLIREFNDRISMIALEEQSSIMAAENLNIVLERLRSGLSTSLEIQEAQRSYQDAVGRLLTAKYNAKIAETEILRLKGELLK